MKNLEEECFSHVFFYPQTGDKSLIYTKSIKCKWSEMNSRIKNILAEKHLGQFGSSVIIKSSTNEDLDLKALGSYFSSGSTFKKARKIMIIVCSAFQDCKNYDLFDQFNNI